MSCSSESPLNLGVIGDPISHSISPQLHRFLFKQLGVRANYAAYHVAPQSLAPAVAGAAALGFRGLNVTLPHKQAVLAYVTELDPLSRRIGAVNTLLFEKQAVRGFNTDAGGFLRSLAAHGISVKGRDAVILGAGGAARSIAHALRNAGSARLIIANRTVAKARELAAAVDGDGCSLEAVPALGGGLIIINATAVGMEPGPGGCVLPEASFRAENVYVDVIYAPALTTFLRRARAAGAVTVGGLDMLIFQGVLALEIWLDRGIDPRPFLPALRAHLNQRLEAPDGDMRRPAAAPESPEQL